MPAPYTPGETLIFPGMKQFLIDHGWIIKMAGAAAVVLAFGWLAGRGVPRQQGGWVHARYPVAVKIFAAVGALFMTAALAWNGTGLFAADWWVPPVFLAMALATYWFVYEAFVASVRWNETEMQVFRPPFAPRSIAFADIVAVRHHATIELVTIRARDGRRVWLSYSYRIGMADLFARIAPPEAAAD